MEIALSAKQMLWQRKVEYRWIHVCSWISCVVGVGNLCVCVCVCVCVRVWSNWLQMSSSTCCHYTKLFERGRNIGNYDVMLMHCEKKKKKKTNVTPWAHWLIREACTHSLHLMDNPRESVWSSAARPYDRDLLSRSLWKVSVVRQWLHVGVEDLNLTALKSWFLLLQIQELLSLWGWQLAWRSNPLCSFGASHFSRK